ncbi:MAG TPA: hypothetical protein VHA70_07210 [Bauldia sp.]|nr:hypothetical protein [Bauldia sp.]
MRTSDEWSAAEDSEAPAPDSPPTPHVLPLRARTVAPVGLILVALVVGAAITRTLIRRGRSTHALPYRIPLLATATVEQAEAALGAALQKVRRLLDR